MSLSPAYSNFLRPLNDFAHNIYSENGEDGIIAEILSRIETCLPSSKWCCEFGAWDGKRASNSFALVERQDWNAVYIEGDLTRFTELLITAEEFSQKIIPICAQVNPDPNSHLSLHRLLLDTPIPKDFDLLSIDIDSFDLDVWEGFSFYSPKIVVIEINSSILPGILQRHSPKSPSNSFTSTVNVGIKKGYTPVCHTGNLIFVRNDLLKFLRIPQRFIDFPELLFLFDSIWIPTEYPKRSMLRQVVHRLLPKDVIHFLSRYL